MTYQPLHQKYRPQTFGELVGQETIATTLSNALRRQRIAPAYLFTGARGTGKTSSARILAKSLNCLKSDVPTATPCGVCDVCQGVAKGSMLDVVEIDAASNTGVDNIRELIEQSQFAPVQCRYKVYAIDECHMLSGAAFNALLKTLEEPPDRVVFVLATTDPQRVLPTIISRCQRFDFRRIPLEAIVRHLQKIAAAEAIEIEETALRLIAQLAQGGLRDAQTLLDQLSLLDETITPEIVWQASSGLSEVDTVALLSPLLQPGGDSLAALRRLSQQGQTPNTIIEGLLRLITDLQQICSVGTVEYTVLPTTLAHLKGLAQSVSVAQLQMLSLQLAATVELCRHSTQPTLWLERAVLDLSPSVKEKVKESAKQQSLDSRETWQQTLEQLPDNLSSLFQRLELEMVDNQNQIVELVAPNAVLSTTAKTKLPALKSAFEAVLGYRVAVEIKVRQPTQFRKPGVDRTVC